MADAVIDTKKPGLMVGWLDLGALLKECAITAALSAVLFLPFIALHADSGGAGGLIIETRWDSWAWFVLAAFIGRALLVVWRENPSSRTRDALTKTVVMPVGGFFRKNMVTIGLVALVLAVIFPISPFGNRYYVDVATTWMIYIMLGWGLNIVVGLAGLLDLGYVAFYAVGAYSYALLSAAGRCLRRLLRRDPGVPSIALARRLLGDCHIGVWGDYPGHPAELVQCHEWSRRHQRHRTPDIVRIGVRTKGRRGGHHLP
jgi:hypothetical protein